MRDGSARSAARRKNKSRNPRSADGNGSARPARPASAPAPVVAQQRLVVRHVDIRSVLKLSVIFYLCLSCVILVAATVLWVVTSVTGARSNIEKFIGELVLAEDFRFVATRMLTLGAVLSVLLVVLGTAANLVMATLYNLISDVIGGFSVVVDGSAPSSVTPDGRPRAEADRTPTRRSDVASSRRPGSG